MPNPQKRARGRKPWLIYTVLSLAVLLAVGLTWRLAFPENFASVFAKGSAPAETHPGRVGVLISPVAIPAYTALDPAMFIDAKTGDFTVVWVLEKTANDGGLIRDPAAIRGRVLKNDKGANLTFSEADFFPRGSRASLTSALEPGQRSVHLSASEIEGLRSLKRFDRFDLYAVKIKAGGAANTAYMDPEAAKLAQHNGEWETDRLVIAQNARVLVPVPDGKNAKNPDSVEVAMTMEEATALADAKAKGAKILCLGSTGLPGGDKTLLTAPTGPALDTIEVITGGKTSTTVVRANKSDEDKQKQDDPPR